VFFIAAGIYAVGAIVFCLLTIGVPSSRGPMSSMELDVAKSTTEPEAVDCRPKSQFNGELPNFGQESLYMQMLSPYFELERTAGKKESANQDRVYRPKQLSIGELPIVGQESLYVQMIAPYFELERMAGKKKYAENSPVCRPQSQSNRELPTADQESLYMQMLSAAYLKSPVYDINR